MELPRGIYLLYHLTGGPNAHIHCDLLSTIESSNYRKHRKMSRKTDLRIIDVNTKLS